MSNKSRSQRSSVSAPEENTPVPNRRARRKEKQRQNAEAGPSNSQPTITSKPPSRTAEGSGATTQSATNGESSFGDNDFIAFSFSDTEEADKQSVRESSPPVREWDRGKAKDKGKEREEHAGRKRKVEEVDFDDGYANKKQRVAAASRKAPWAQDVDWDKCRNVAEMCVRAVPLAYPGKMQLILAFGVIGCTRKWRHSFTTCLQHQ